MCALGTEPPCFQVLIQRLAQDPPLWGHGGAVSRLAKEAGTTASPGKGTLGQETELSDTAGLPGSWTLSGSDSQTWGASQEARSHL